MKEFLLFCILLFAGGLTAGLPSERPLYAGVKVVKPFVLSHDEIFADSVPHPEALSGTNRVYSYVTSPVFQFYPANDDNNRHVGLVIFPGGGLRNIWLDKEGTDIALWFSKQGINCMVVKYRTNSRTPQGKWEINFRDYYKAVLADAETAMKVMKQMADSIGFDRDRVGVMGFSAGGWLAEQLVFSSYSKENLHKPAFVALIYHGNKLKLIEKSKHREKLPPFFMAYANNDEKLPYQQVAPYLKFISEEAKNSVLHVYPDGHHGFGLAFDSKMAVSAWKNDFLKWLDQLYPVK